MASSSRLVLGFHADPHAAANAGARSCGRRSLRWTEARGEVAGWSIEANAGAAMRARRAAVPAMGRAGWERGRSMAGNRPLARSGTPIDAQAVIRSRYSDRPLTKASHAAHHRVPHHRVPVFQHHHDGVSPLPAGATASPGAHLTESESSLRLPERVSAAPRFPPTPPRRAARSARMTLGRWPRAQPQASTPRSRGQDVFVVHHMDPL